VNDLANWTTAVRLSLHVAAATIWVGGQFTMLGLLGDLRKLGGDASVTIARAFGRIAWPAYGVLILTGFWNLSAVHGSTSTTAWKVVLGVKLAVVVLAGIAAWLHGRATTKPAIAAWGSIAGAASVGALVLGVLLAG
jgi:putative copper export protein